MLFTFRVVCFALALAEVSKIPLWAQDPPPATASQTPQAVMPAINPQDVPPPKPGQVVRPWQPGDPEPKGPLQIVVIAGQDGVNIVKKKRAVQPARFNAQSLCFIPKTHHLAIADGSQKVIAELSNVDSGAAPSYRTLALTPNASLTGLSAGYMGDAGFVSSSGTKTASATVAIPAATTSVAFPTFDPGTVAGNVGVTLTVGGQTVASAAVTIQPAAPIIEAGSVQINGVTASGFNVELVATSTTRDLQTAQFTFNAAAGATLNGTSFTVNVAPLLTAWFASTDGLNYGGAFSLTIPFTLSGSASAIGSVSVTLTNSVGTSASATGVQ